MRIHFKVDTLHRIRRHSDNIDLILLRRQVILSRRLIYLVQVACKSLTASEPQSVDALVAAGAAVLAPGVVLSSGVPANFVIATLTGLLVLGVAMADIALVQLLEI